jgi:hypothetical protein
MFPFTLGSYYTVARWREVHSIASKRVQLDPSKLQGIQLGGDDLSGKVKLKVEPLPTMLSTQIFSPMQFDKLLRQG